MADNGCDNRDGLLDALSEQIDWGGLAGLAEFGKDRPRASNESETVSLRLPRGGRDLLKQMASDLGYSSYGHFIREACVQKYERDTAGWVMRNVDDGRLWITPREFADMIGFNIQTLRNWRKSGYGPAWHRVNRRVRYHRQNVYEWMDEMEESWSA